MLKPETIERATQEIRKGYAQYRYFFEQLNSPSWLEPLAERGFFSKPPDPQKVDGQHVRFPPWPESSSSSV